MTHALGSRTSGVDGSSEGGRINTISLPGALVLYGVPLLQTLQRQNPKSKLSMAPVQANGVWSLEITYTGEPPADVPELWHGHRVIVRSTETPSA
ncbi:MAG: hypothetical protein E6I23_05895 [Chloroflexi bacterium]|nr:MAG: hypothetical protein E6I23_05895 [Chloroflexota bacterium]